MDALSEKIKNIIYTMHEGQGLEYKEATGSLPKEFWETYSAFCNTGGGIIILGVRESSSSNEIIGVTNSREIISTIWNLLSNPNKVSYNALGQLDAWTTEIDGKTVIVVNVYEVLDCHKPVYINGRLEDAYIRTGDGDRKVTRDQLRSMLRNASPTMDAEPARDISFDDLDLISVTSFKEKISIRYPGRKYDQLSLEDFLLKINAIYFDSHSKVYQLRYGTLLFLGKYNSIRRYFPHYFLDYVNQGSASKRWLDRVSSDDLSDVEMNVYNFYTIVFEKIKAILSQEFALDNEHLRVQPSGFDEVVREALINCLAHADYALGFPSTKIQVNTGWMSFLNPGKMLVSKEQFINGGDSRPRNEYLMNYFRYLGASERQGGGGPKIFQSALENSYRTPEICGI